MDIAFSDGKVTLYNGDVLEVLASMAEGSVQSVISSPPYWGLRDYGLPPSVWGGDPACGHEWESEEIPPRHSDDGVTGSTLGGGKATQAQAQRTPTTHSLCRLCGAWRGCHGLEPTPELWVENELAIFRALRRVLRDDGTIWWNIGDSYSGGKQGRDDFDPSSSGLNLGTNPEGKQRSNAGQGRHRGPPPGMQSGQLMLMPYRLALALQGEGWIVRSVIIWSKGSSFLDKSGSVMPESVAGWRWERCRVKTKPSTVKGKGDPGVTGIRTWVSHNGQGAKDPKVGEDATWTDCPGCPKCAENDGLVLRRGSWRPTSAYEVVLMIAKGPGYFADGEGVREENTDPSRVGTIPGGHYPDGADAGVNAGWLNGLAVPSGRNLRNVFRINTAPYPAAHFATFPPALVEPLVKMSTPEAGSCGACGAPCARIVERGHENPGNRTTNGPRSLEQRHETAGFGVRLEATSTTLGHRPTCGCGAEAVPPVVLDPFAGSGTTLHVARSLGCTGWGIELNPEYCKLAAKRLQQGVLF